MENIISGGTDEHPPPNQEEFEQPPGYHFSHSRDTRRTPPMVFWNLSRAGSGTSRGALAWMLRGSLHPRCVSNSYPFNQ